jgi:hypothetical protein
LYVTVAATIVVDAQASLVLLVTATPITEATATASVTAAAATPITTAIPLEKANSSNSVETTATALTVWKQQQ